MWQQEMDTRHKNKHAQWGVHVYSHKYNIISGIVAFRHRYWESWEQGVWDRSIILQKMTSITDRRISGDIIIFCTLPSTDIAVSWLRFWCNDRFFNLLLGNNRDNNCVNNSSSFWLICTPASFSNISIN
jgi:hypothetical protein